MAYTEKLLILVSVTLRFYVGNLPFGSIDQKSETTHVSYLTHGKFVIRTERVGTVRIGNK